MLGRYKRVWIAVTLLATLLIPAVGSHAGPRDELARTKAKLAELRDRIAAERGEIDTTREEIAVVNEQITEVQIEINGLDQQVAKLEAAVREAQGRIDATQAEIDQTQVLATRQAVALYKSGATDALDALLDSADLNQLQERVKFLGVAAEKNTGALVRFARLRLEIQDEKAALFDRKDALGEVLDSRQDFLAEREKLKLDLKSHLKAVGEKLAKHKHHEGELEAAADRITQEILAAQAPSVAHLGVSGSGFIWPLNGNVTSPYGPRWGRMHTGIDIDGYAGQPIVASKGGRVILAEYYSGYGNTVIIDHGGGLATLYGHLSAFSVSNGQSVSQGQQVGAVGCTGSCTGDHLHFEVRVNGDPVDPMGYLP